MKDSSVKFCPVPYEQQPINEYSQLKDSWLFRWATIEGMGYWRKLANVGLWGLLISSPIAAASFTPAKDPLRFGLLALAGAFFWLALLIVRLYLGWSYISDRLQQEKVFYEESGWYDGQMWEKPPEIITRDRLIATYQVAPILQKLQKTALILTLLFASGCLLWLYI